MDSRALFEKICEMSGVSGVLAPGLVKRSLSDSGANVDTATADDYRRALPRLVARLRAYMSDEESQRRQRRIAGFLAHADGELESEDEADWSLFGRVHEALRAGTPGSGVSASSMRTPLEGVPIQRDFSDTTQGRRLTAEEQGILRRARSEGSAEHLLGPAELDEADAKKR